MLERNFLWNMGTEHESAEVSFYVQKIRVAQIQVERKGMHAVIHIVLTYWVVVTGKKIMFKVYLCHSESHHVSLAILYLLYSSSINCSPGSSCNPLVGKTHLSESCLWSHCNFMDAWADSDYIQQLLALIQLLFITRLPIGEKKLITIL